MLMAIGYNRPWRTYNFGDDDRIEPIAGSYASIKVSVIKQLAHVFSGRSILDVGTDYGLMSRYVPKDIKEFVGVDVCDLSDANSLKLDDKQISFYQRNIFDETFCEWHDKFDIAISLSMLHVIVPEFSGCCRTKFPPRPSGFTLDSYFQAIRYYSRALLFDCISWDSIDTDRLVSTANRQFYRSAVVSSGRDSTGFGHVIVLSGY